MPHGNDVHQLDETIRYLKKKKEKESQTQVSMFLNEMINKIQNVINWMNMIYLALVQFGFTNIFLHMYAAHECQ